MARSVSFLPFRVLARDFPTVSVCIPARNEEHTVASVVSSVRRAFEAAAIASEIIVVDDRSSDATAQRSREAGAIVIQSAQTMHQFGPSRGKGDALWRALSVCNGSIVVWCDADLSEFDFSGLTDLARCLLDDVSAVLVKGSFARVGATGPASPGRVTALVARPLLEFLAPELAHVRQPIGGLLAARRQALERLRFETDYGVDIGVLIDVAQLYGANAVREIDVGSLRHRSRPLDDLVDTARAVQRVILDRCGVIPIRDYPPTRPSLASLRTATSA